MEGERDGARVSEEMRGGKRSTALDIRRILTVVERKTHAY